MCIRYSKKKLNLSNKFIYGSILPDVLKVINNDREGTHYLEKVGVDGEVRNLPVIQKAIDSLDIQDKEIRMGYISHLVEDLIWFDKYVPAYAKKISENEIRYTLDESLHTGEEFRDDMYFDYSNSSEYITKKCDVDMDKMLYKLTCDIKDREHIKIMLDNTKYPKGVSVETNIFMTKESIDKYITESVEEVEKIVLNLMGE